MTFARSVLMVFALASVLRGGERAPNVVWIIADDMSPDTGAYGLADVHTPNLDRLAVEGMRCARAYASAPVCSSSRSAFILGCYQTTTGLHPHDVERPQPLPAPYRHLPGMLRDAGWLVTNAPGPGAMRSGKKVTKAKTHYNFAHDPKEMYDGLDWRERKPGQPFFAQFQITEPHRAFPIPERYDEEKLAALQIPANYPDHPLIRRDWYAYHRSVEVVDQRVGVILDQLEEEGELENTLVMFFADHGRPMPWGKQWLSVEGLHVPLIVRGPGIEAGRVESRLVSLIDLAPTVLAKAGLRVPEWMEGRPLLDGDFPEREVLFAARDRCGDAMDRIRAVIGMDELFVRNYHPELSRLNWSGYKETSYPGMPLMRVLKAEGRLDTFQGAWVAETRAETEYYALKTDPLGIHNSVTDPATADAVQKLGAELEAKFGDGTDQGAKGDPATEMPFAEIQASKRQDYQQAWEKRLGKAEPTDEERLDWWLKEYDLD